MKNSGLFQHSLGVFPAKPETMGKLANNILSWQEQGDAKCLSLEDVIGVSLVNLEESQFPCLIVHAYPVVKTISFKQPTRKLIEYCFTCPNLEVRSQWQTQINQALARKLRHFQVIINPASGKQKSHHLLAQICLLLDKSYLTYSLRETSSSNDLKNFVQKLNLAEVDGLIIVGGDGTVHDVITGLMSRPDSQLAIKLPLGIIPGGTGNGLSKSLLTASGETYSPLNAAFLIAKGKLQSLDVISIQQSQQQYYGFLSLAWGLISDVDINSEKLRFLGSLRFDLYALWLIFCLQTYQGKFSFIPHPDCPELKHKALSKQGEWYVIEDEFIFLWAMNTPWAAHDMNVTPYAQLNDGAIDVLIMRKGTSRLEIIQALLLCGKGKHLELPHLEYYKVRACHLEPQTAIGLLVVDGEPIDYAPIQMQVMSNLACVAG